MSGAEAALLGVGILCNAMQILTFAKDSIHVYRNIRDGRAPDPKLDSYLKNAKISFNEMNQTAAQIGPLGQTQQQIVDVGKKVNDCMNELQQQFAKLHVDEPSRRGLRGRVTASKKSALALWRGKELEDAEHNLQRHEQLLHSLFLDQICSQSQAAEITSLDSFKHLSVALQSIISQLVDGSTKISDLITDFSSNMDDRLVEEHAMTRTAIEGHVALAENRIRQSVSQSIDQLRQELLEREKDRSFEKQYEQLLSSLLFPKMNSRKNGISNNHPGTFDWIFNRHNMEGSNRGPSSEFDQPGDDGQISEFIHSSDVDGCRCPENEPGFDCFPGWLESNSKLFWVSGKPASGKSSLMKFLAFKRLTADHLNAWRPNVRVLTHFFWKPGQLLERNVEGMALSLLYQVLDGKTSLSRRLCEAQLSVRQKRCSSDWNLEELTEAIVWSLKASPAAFCIFLDGLDEAEELEHLPRPDWTNAEVIHKLLEVDDVKLCASSREEQAFCSFFECASWLRIHQLNDYDITLFVRERLDICGLKCSDRDALIGDIVGKAEGVFLWVAIVVKRLNLAVLQRHTTLKLLQERLQQTPSDLTKLYTDMWGRIGDDAQLPSIRVTASLYFNLVIIARQLNDYLQEAIRYDWDPATMGMSSILVLAAAVQDMSMEDILRTGRFMTVEGVLDICSRVENDLKYACGGLLEARQAYQCISYLEKGDERLFEYNLTTVDFIHRSAFDFLTSSETGRECLEFCQSSQSEQASRLLAAHLIRSRFIHLKIKPVNGPIDIDQLTRNQLTPRNAYLPVAVGILHNQRFFVDEAVRDALYNILKEWQLSGLFGDHGTMAHYFQLSSTYLEAEFLQVMISLATRNRVLWHGIVDFMRFLHLISMAAPQHITGTY
ncbi:hypothetical protein FNYG_05936 [Fusarium nygamai]|uniref:NACHT domain-containing protein n=1 Tax=Gibberella nygamai TaxID=42673 RepID=A0A2K0WDH0_GIBNY|nr:hypothetical protein FNYG_05936 [Fusarium nygamai]